MWPPWGSTVDSTLPPIHPIGANFARGGTTRPLPDQPTRVAPGRSVPREGRTQGHSPTVRLKLEDFRHLIAAATQLGIEVALDIAFQCAPDHPYVTEHPEWFPHRPDGTIQYAENPPKKYQDIYPFDFETESWRELWEELKSIYSTGWTREFEYSVSITRTPSPSPSGSRSLPRSKTESPEVIFLAEASRTPPKALYGLASVFHSSYNYFPWRNTKWKLTQYLTELTRADDDANSPVRTSGPTPQISCRVSAIWWPTGIHARFVLAATLGPSYGIYGPAFELCENKPVAPGREEYINREI